MNCPYCESEMTKGVLTGDARQKVRWQNDGEKISFLEKNFSKKGRIDAYYSLVHNYFQISGYYCDKCGKIIINAKPKE